ncbi:S41 family peptidase [Elstera litoralis]|nr:S41 family peptidase [Elstera litoralis]
MVLTQTLRLCLGTAFLMVGGCGAGATDGTMAPTTNVLGALSRVTPVGLFGASTDEKTAADAQGVPVRDMEEVLTFVYKSVNSNYVDRAPLKPLVVAGLSGLSRLDAKIAVQDQGSSLRLTYDGKPIAQLDPPSNTESPSGWSRVAATGTALAESASPALRGIETDDIISALLNPALGALDPYTRYLSPAQARDEKASRSGFGGVGVTLDTEQIGVIRTVLDDTPAAKAGLVPGDRLTSVGDKPVQPLTQNQLIALLRGEIGAPVTLTIQRGEAPAFTRTLKRMKIYQTTVRGQRDDAGIAVVKLSGFNDGTLDAFKAQMRKLTDAGPVRGMVLDLRDNPGGIFRTALDIADLFLSDGPIMTVRDRRGIVSESVASAGDEVLPSKVPLVLLTNGQTASASEVLAAALQDRGRAVVVGSRSFGKGLVQTVYEDLPNKGEFIMTTMRLHSPLGYSLHKYGVVPTVCTSRQADAPTSAAQITADMRTPDFHPEDVLQARRTVDKATEAARETLVGLCPPLTKPRTNDVDMAVAESLLADPGLYARALPAPTIARKP